MDTGPRSALCLVRGRTRRYLLNLANGSAVFDDGRCWSIAAKGLVPSGWRSAALEAEAREKHKRCREREERVAAKVKWFRRGTCGAL